MDEGAVRAASEQHLKDLGLTEIGNIIALKAFARQRNKQVLRNLVADAGTERVARKRSISKSRTVYLGWKNYDKMKNAYCGVRESRGGGVRQHKFSCDASTEQIVNVAKKLFFPKEKSMLGELPDFQCYLGTNDEQILSEDCSLEHLIQLKGFVKVRLYLLTKKKSRIDILQRKINVIDDNDSDPEDFVDQPLLHTNPPPLLQSTIRDEDFEADELMHSRASRVPEEPSLTEPHECLSIAHPSLGNLNRIVHADSTFVSVYDWIGSQAREPKYFMLEKVDGGGMVMPEQKTFSGAFTVVEMPEPIQMMESPTVSFKGFALASQNYLDDLRADAEKKFHGSLVLDVDRDNIYNDMIRHFKRRSVLTSKIQIVFKGEDAVGDGVSKDAFSQFFESLSSKMDGTYSKVPSSNLDEDELEVAGKIISAGFILYKVFPLFLSKASLEHHLFSSVLDESLYQSFMSFLPSNEKDLFEKNNFDNLQAISDVLSEFSIFTSPKKENIHQLAVSAARVALIKQPCFGFQALVRGMGHFWKKTSPEMLEMLYEKNIPTPSKVIENLLIVESNKIDAKITTWLHRYLRSCDRAELSRFIRFVTGSDLFDQTKIRCEFVNQPVEHLRPKSKTCFKMFYLPRQYLSFYHLRDNLNLYMKDTSTWTVHDV